MAEEEPNEYTCPECGSAFVEGAESCPVCGTVFDWSEETDYVCPECGARVPHDSKSCPECGAQFVVEGEGTDRGIESMLEAAVAETIVTPKKDGASSEGEAAVPEAPAALEETGHAEEVVEGDEGDVPGAPAPEEAREAPPAPAKAATAQAREPVKEAKASRRGTEAAGKAAPPTASARRRYPGGFSWVGLLFIIMAGIALALTVVALRWDAISSGSKYETIGAMQSMVIVTGIAGFIVCAFVSMWDLLRGPRPQER